MACNSSVREMWRWVDRARANPECLKQRGLSSIWGWRTERDATLWPCYAWLSFLMTPLSDPKEEISSKEHSEFSSVGFQLWVVILEWDAIWTQSQLSLLISLRSDNYHHPNVRGNTIMWYFIIYFNIRTCLDSRIDALVSVSATLFLKISAKAN